MSPIDHKTVAISGCCIGQAGMFGIELEATVTVFSWLAPDQ